ncbi:tripartite tricarboxylate transporter TctB family protein [Starkeya koreensis]|uniref:Tripartite tricarboxylate transporter TctB family protein n=1 Tax=Ancylobacter koreensis TaxID=266121 RepID=A0ABT0DQJ0_9HYPH|nr:tripartite tricarboxylate transporter TctB family protein [Ancylobacter koreensis]MCK0209454.1 tripartite tricarboxylate transporter TctB family protein [Ancylobacter koreensis]
MLRYLRDPNILFGSGLSVLGLYIVQQSLGWVVYERDGPGPGFFPLIYGGAMLFFALWLTLKALRAGGVAAPRPEDELNASGRWEAIATLVALAASVPLMWAFGFIPGFGLVLFFIIRVVFARPTLNAAIVATCIAGALYLGFAELLQSPLPASAIWGF